MDSDSDIIYDSEPDRRAETAGSTRNRNHLRRTSDERPGINSEGSTAELEKERGRRKQKMEKPQEVLVLDSGSEGEGYGSATSKYFQASSNTSPKRRRTRSPPTFGNGVDEGWPFSGEVRIGSRSPPLAASRRASSRSLSTSFSASPADSQLPPVASTSRLPSAPKASSPFTSALDLLHSRPTPPDDSFDDSSNLKETTTSKKSRSKSVSSTSVRTKPATASKGRPLEEKNSASSVEIIETSKVEKKGKKKAKEEEEDEEGNERSSVTPENWVEQFSAKSGKSSRLKGKGKAAEEVVPIQDGKRRKPWESLEAKVAAGGSVKKRTTTRTKKATKVVAKEEEASDDDDDLQVIDPKPGSSTALKPCPSGRLSHLALASSSTFTKKKSTRTDSQDPTVFSVPQPLVLPCDDRLKCLTHCPLCAFASSHTRSHTSVDSWGSKALAARQTHLRMCAKSHDYTAETVSHLVNQQILVSSVESEEKRLERELEKTLFDRAIGKGEGTGGREVTVIGIETNGRTLEGDKEWYKDIKEVQEEVDGWRRKSKRGGIEERLARVAKEIKRELDTASKKESDGTETEVEGEAEAGEKEEEGLPRATGRLRPETELDRDQVSKRAKELLDLANGTQLTGKTVLVLDDDTSMEDASAKKGEQDDLSLFQLPPSTQTFEDSTLANRCHHDGAINIVRPLSLSSPSKGKSRSPLHEIDLAFSSDDEEIAIPRTSSLWRANSGKDEASLSRIVHSPSPFASSPSRRRTPSPIVSCRNTGLGPQLSTLTLSSGSSSSSIASLPDPSTLLPRQIGSSRNLVTSRRKSPSRSPTNRGKGKGKLELATAGLGSGKSSRRSRGEGDVETEPEMEWMDEGEEGWDVAGAVLIGGAGESGGTGGGEVESSEEEALANLIARTPTKSRGKKDIVTGTRKSGSTRRRISPSSPSASSDSDLDPPPLSTLTKPRSGDPPGMPAYSSLPLSTLHKEVQKYGYRPSKEKSVVVQQLKEVWKAINKDKVAAWERGELDDTAGSGKKTKGRKAKKKAAVEEDRVEVPKTKGRRKRRAIVADTEDVDETEEGETRTVGERLRELIVNDEKLYLRILRYEPIHLDEFILLAANNNVKVARTLLIRCLDEQSITFYQEDPTNGQRKRHK